MKTPSFFEHPSCNQLDFYISNLILETFGVNILSILSTLLLNFYII